MRSDQLTILDLDNASMLDILKSAVSRFLKNHPKIKMETGLKFMLPFVKPAYRSYVCTEIFMQKQHIPFELRLLIFHPFNVFKQLLKYKLIPANMLVFNYCQS